MSTCVFCRIVRHDEPARYVAFIGDSVSFHPLNPVTPGHILVVPKHHVADFTENPEVTAAVMRDAAQLAQSLGGDCNLITSKGALATQTIMHLHVHLIPRQPADRLRLPWTDQER